MKLNGQIFCYTENKVHWGRSLWKRSKPWPWRYRRCGFFAASRRPLDLTLEETTRTFCSPIIWSSCGIVATQSWVCRHICPRRCLEKCGACPSCGNPICRPQVMAPPFPPPQPFRGACTERNGEEAVQMYLTVALPLVPWNNATLSTCAITAGGPSKQTGTSRVDHKNVV